jgi:hypothetical protein
MAEYELLTHRVRQIERERAREAALASAPTLPAVQEAVRAATAEQKADDLQLAVQLAAVRERAEVFLSQLNRHYLQISASLLVAGAVDEAVGVESFLTQQVNRSGQHVVYSPRLGLEAGVIPEILKLRAGSYVEPTRFDTSDPRVHATLGADIRLFRWNVFGLWPDDYMWRLGLGGDVSRRYLSWGLTIGGWYPRRGGSPSDSATATD